MGLMCVLWSCKLRARQIAWHSDISSTNCHTRPDLIPTLSPLLVLVSLMENIDFWLPASVHYIQGMSHKMVQSHNCSPGPQTAPWGRGGSRTETIMFADLSSLLSGAEWRQGANTSGSPGARCRQPFTPVVCQTNVTYLVYWAFYPALSPVTWVGFERSQELPILVNTRQDKRTYCSYRHQQQVTKINHKITIVK